jgi:lactate dehydrogenase-like 2-hydroxyacid dehydrogenase
MARHILAIHVEQHIAPFASLADKCADHVVVLAEEPEDAYVKVKDPRLIEIILVSIYQQLSPAFLAQFPNLLAINVLGTSLKKLPMEYCQQHQIKVLHVTDYCDHETAEWVMLQIIDHFRRRKNPSSVYLKKLGVIGAGVIGRHLLQKAQAFHMKVFYNGERRDFVLEQNGIAYLSKEEMLAVCDVVSFHTPPEKVWLSGEILANAKPDLCLINTAMGRLSKDDDLKNFLSMRKDVSLIMDKIAEISYPELKGLANIRPELAFYTSDSHQRLIDKFFINLANLVLLDPPLLK